MMGLFSYVADLQGIINTLILLIIKYNVHIYFMSMILLSVESNR